METNSRIPAMRHAAHLAPHLAPHGIRLPADEARPYQLVAKRIRALILQSAIGPGDRLPPERKLATLLAVSRPTLREAMIALEVGGVVEVRSCSGVYLRAAPQPDVPVRKTGADPFELLSARRLIEPELAAMAARVATDNSIDAILAATVELERLQRERPDDRSGFRRAAHDFHLKVARATGNGELTRVFEQLSNDDGCLLRAMERFFETDELRRQAVAEHRQILRAIATHDAAAARRAMRTHLERAALALSRF
jgi:DNA-binding FadR family transcriptional regulator